MSPNGQPKRELVPDLTYHLEPAIRERLSGRFDTDALEKLLRVVEPSFRVFLLETLTPRQSPDGEFPHIQTITDLGDPRLQTLLDEVWAPFWDHLPAEALADPSVRLPGRDLAKARRVGGMDKEIPKR